MNCDHCDAQFVDHEAVDRRFCSLRCHDLHWHSDETSACELVTCQECGKEALAESASWHPSPYMAFCSGDCHEKSLVDHPDWAARQDRFFKREALELKAARQAAVEWQEHFGSYESC